MLFRTFAARNLELLELLYYGKRKEKKKKRAAKDSRQQIAADWIQENYLQFNRLRVDTVRQRVQINTPNPLQGGGVSEYSQAPSLEGVGVSVSGETYSTETSTTWSANAAPKQAPQSHHEKYSPSSTHPCYRR